MAEGYRRNDHNQRNERRDTPNDPSRRNREYRDPQRDNEMLADADGNDTWSDDRDHGERTWNQPRERGQGNYGQGNYNRSNYGQGSYGQGSYGQGNYGQGSYGQGNYGQGNHGQSSYGQGSYGQGNYSRSNHGQGNYGQSSYGQGSDREKQGFGSNQDSYDSFGNRGHRDSERGWSRGQADADRAPWNHSMGLGHQQPYNSGSSWSPGSERSALNRLYDRERDTGEAWTKSSSQSFSGKGPKNYTRSDDRIREDVCDRLSDDDEVDASDVTVTVRDGEVTLEGSVNDRRAKHRAEDIADNVRGVKDVHNRLSARKGMLQEIGDRITGKEESPHGHSGSGTRNSVGATSTTAGSTAGSTVRNGI